MTYSSDFRGLALLQEVDLANHLIRKGLAAYQSIPRESFGGVDYHVPILFLSNGLERLCKCGLCVNFLTDAGRLPYGKEVDIKEYYNHDLTLLVADLISSYQKTEPIESLKEFPPDLDLLENNPTVNQAFQMLSSFGRGGRYSYLDIVIGLKPDIEQIPEISFDTLMGLIVQNNERLVTIKTDPEKSDEFIDTLDKEIVCLFEKITRSVGRLFRYNSDAAAQEYLRVMGFILIEDNALGNIDYRV